MAFSPDFLHVCPGDFVVIGKDSSIGDDEQSDWWIGEIICCIGGARSPGINTIFQVADVDTGFVKTINADLVKVILLQKKLYD